MAVTKTGKIKMERGGDMKALDIKETSAITRELNAVMKAADFSLLEARHVIGGRDQAVYELMYMNGKNERVFIIAHEPPKG